MTTRSANSTSFTNSNQIFTANINSLPAELLKVIFTLVVSPSELKRANTQFPLAWVCRYWRQIIHDSSNFWTTMSFGSQYSRDSEYIESVLRRSSSRELVVFGPSPSDIESNPKNWIKFHKFLQIQSSRIKALLLGGLPEYPITGSDSDDDDQPSVTPTESCLLGLSNLVFENLQTLSIVYSDIVSVDFQAAVPNLQALQITAHSTLLPRQLSPHLRRLSLRVPLDNDLLMLLAAFKELEYLSILFDYSLRMGPVSNHPRIKLPNLTTLKSNSFKLIDILSAPALTHIELAASLYSPADSLDVCKLVDELDLSQLTRLYIGYALPSFLLPNTECLDDLANPIDGCIWASVGPTEIPCCSDQATIFRGHNCRSTELPSSWSTCGPKDKPLFHVHTPRSYNFVKGCTFLPCKLIARMTSLETLVLCFPDTPYPPSYDPRSTNPEPYRFCSTDIFREIARPEFGLRHLIIRSGSFQADHIKMLSECFGEEIWFKHSCPLLESVTYQGPTPRIFSESLQQEFWQTWVNFIELRKNDGRPLKLFRIIGSYSPSPATSKKLEDFSIFTEVVTEDADDTAYRSVSWKCFSKSRGVEFTDDKCYPSRGF